MPDVKGEPKYRKAFDTLKGEILDGKYSSRKSFPSVVATCARFGISRLTAVKALDKLKDEGLISSRIGSGTFVTKGARSRLVGLVVPGIAYSSEFFQPIVSELVRRARDLDYTIVMDGIWSPKAADNGREAIEVAARLIKRRVAGVIYQPLEYSEHSEAINRRVLAAFRKAGIPVVLLDGDIVPGPRRSEYDLVSIDNVAAGETLAAHMMERGARNIRFLMRANWVENVKNRARGVRNAVLANGLRWTDRSVILADAADVEAVRKIMRRAPRPDGFICENDVIAAGLKNALESIGVRVPDDVLLAGFDDVQIARLLSPGITTIHQPCGGIAQAAFDRLALRMSNPDMMPTHLVLPSTLVVRGTTKGLLGKRERKGARR